jgi:hypothetical protein
MERWISIPEPVAQAYRQWRPTPLYRAHALERELDTPAEIYFKYEGASPSGSHKLNSALAQAYYAKQEGVKRLITDTGAGQWGVALALAGALMGIEVVVYMVRASFHHKPGRRHLMETFGATVLPSPGTNTEAARVPRPRPRSPRERGDRGVRGARGRAVRFGRALRHGRVRQPRAAAPDRDRHGGARAARARRPRPRLPGRLGGLRLEHGRARAPLGPRQAPRPRHHDPGRRAAGVPDADRGRVPLRWATSSCRRRSTRAGSATTAPRRWPGSCAPRG